MDSLLRAPVRSDTNPAAGRVSCVVVTHNAGPRIRDCLASLERAGTVKVVDNASSDDTVEMIRQEFPGVDVIALGKNLGYGGAANLAIERIRTEYVAIVNQDLIGTDGWIERLVEALDCHPDAALATPRIVLTDDPSRLNTCGNEVHYSGITPCRGYGQPANRFEVLEEISAVSGAAFVARRSTYEAVGGFDASFFLYLEDTDLSLRVALAGHRCLYVPESVVTHEFIPRFSSPKIYFLERNRHVLLLKMYRWRTLLVLAPALMLVELAVWGYAALRGPTVLRSKARAYAWVATHHREILAARRQTQALRRTSDRALLARFATELRLGELGSAGRIGGALASPLLRAWRRVADAVISW